MKGEGMKRIFTIIALAALTAIGALAQQAKSSTEALINTYFDSLNETNSTRRAELTRRVWTEKGKFGTPLGEAEGWAGIESLVIGVQKEFPGAIVRRTSRIDGFGKYLRWSFTLSHTNGTPIVSGVDFAIIENGKLQLVMGFFDLAPDPAGRSQY